LGGGFVARFASPWENLNRISLISPSLQRRQTTSDDAPSNRPPLSSTSKWSSACARNGVFNHRSRSDVPRGPERLLELAQGQVPRLDRGPVAVARASQ
jgi:hypothetical protein